MWVPISTRTDRKSGKWRRAVFGNAREDEQLPKIRPAYEEANEQNEYH